MNVSIGHVIPISVEEQHPMIWLVSTMLKDVKNLFNPLVSIQEKISICKTWVSFLANIKGSVGIDPSDLDDLTQEKIHKVANELIAYIVQQLNPHKHYLK